MTSPIPRAAGRGDLEVGATAWSLSITRSSGAPAGGVIIELAKTYAKCLPNVVPSEGPAPYELGYDDIDYETVTFDTRNARVTAAQLFRWLAAVVGEARPGRRHRTTEWAHTAYQLLALANDAGYTPRAEDRYRQATAR